MIKLYKNTLLVSLFLTCLSGTVLADSQMNFLVLADFHYRSVPMTPIMEIFPKKKYNDLNMLDSRTFSNMLPQIKTVIATTKPKFILILGDFSGYESDNKTTYDDIKAVLTRLSY